MTSQVYWMKEEELTGADSALRLFASVAGVSPCSTSACSLMLFKSFASMRLSGGPRGFYTLLYAQ